MAGMAVWMGRLGSSRLIVRRADGRPIQRGTPVSCAALRSSALPNLTANHSIHRIRSSRYASGITICVTRLGVLETLFGGAERGMRRVMQHPGQRSFWTAPVFSCLFWRFYFDNHFAICHVAICHFVGLIADQSNEFHHA